MSNDLLCAPDVITDYSLSHFKWEDMLGCPYLFYTRTLIYFKVSSLPFVLIFFTNIFISVLLKLLFNVNIFIDNKCPYIYQIIINVTF